MGSRLKWYWYRDYFFLCPQGPKFSPFPNGHWVKHGMEWNGLEWLEWNGMDWNGMEWNGLEWSGIEWNGLE